MRNSDYPLLGEHYWKTDRQQGQHNRSARDGEYLLPKIVEEFGNDPFTEDEFRDAFYAFVPTSGTSETSRRLNVIAGLESLVEEGYILKDAESYCVTDKGLSLEDQLTGGNPTSLDAYEDN